MIRNIIYGYLIIALIVFIVSSLLNPTYLKEGDGRYLLQLIGMSLTWPSMLIDRLFFFNLNFI